MPLSLYVHVPFCRSRCRYCAFYSGEPLDLLPDYPAWIAAEARLRPRALERGTAPVSTLYLGGGTPSLLPASAVGSILQVADRTWGLAPDAEITLEVNPDSGVDLIGLRTAGVTRLSLGIQCLDDSLLRSLGRPHSVRQALDLLSAAARARYTSVSADLLLGLPGVRPQALTRWVTTLRDAGAGHISTYSLEVHEGTALAAAVADGSCALPSAEEEDDQWAAADEALTSCGFGAYEVSNYCLPGQECRHNLAYWERSPYLGLGPGAHSFDPVAGPWGTRSWNDPDLAGYTQHLSSGFLPPGGAERLEAHEALLEGLFLALRRPVPFPLDHLLSCHGAPIERIAPLLEEAAASGLLAPVGSLPTRTWRPSREGLRRADALALWLCGPASAPRPSAQTP